MGFKASFAFIHSQLSWYAHSRTKYVTHRIKRYPRTGIACNEIQAKFKMAKYHENK